MAAKCSRTKEVQATPTATAEPVPIAGPAGHDDGRLPPDVWHMILQKLPVAGMARAACVCRLWHQMVADPDLMAAAFRAAWKLKEVRGRPASGSFWRCQRLSQFAISHELRRQDTVRGLAVRYQVQVGLSLWFRSFALTLLAA